MLIFQKSSPSMNNVVKNCCNIEIEVGKERPLLG
jgi:hypothetical protein